MSVRITRMCLRGLLWWACSVIVLLPCGAAVMLLCPVSLRGLGIAISVLSLMTGFFAGRGAGGGMVGALISGALVCGVIMLCALAVNGTLRGLNGLVSAIPFTLAGAAAAGLLRPAKRKKFRRR